MQKSNHSLHPMAHTGFKQLEPLCQVKRLNVPLEKKLTAKTDGGEMEFCLLSSMQPFFSFNVALLFKQIENLALCLEPFHFQGSNSGTCLIAEVSYPCSNSKSAESTAQEWVRRK